MPGARDRRDACGMPIPPHHIAAGNGCQSPSTAPESKNTRAVVRIYIFHVSAGPPLSDLSSLTSIPGEGIQPLVFHVMMPVLQLIQAAGKTSTALEDTLFIVALYSDGDQVL
jgi:hypothetical protein